MLWNDDTYRLHLVETGIRAVECFGIPVESDFPVQCISEASFKFRGGGVHIYSKNG